MNPDIINDLRNRLVRVRQLEAQGEEVPDGLRPTDGELQAALLAASASRIVTSEAAAIKKAGGSKITADTDLGSLF